MLSDRALAVLVEGRWKPKRPAIGKRTKASVEMVKTRINEFYRDGQTAKHVCHGPMRLNIGAKFVAAKEHVAAKERVAFALEIKILGQPLHLVVAFFHPFRKERLLTSTFFVAEIAGNKLATNRQSSVGG